MAGLQRLAGNARRQPTPAERIMWAQLRDSRLDGFKFRQQYTVASFRVDFYCAVGRLVIELDGPIHDTQTNADVERQAYLEQYGYRFLRFTNQQVSDDLPSVLDAIRAAPAAKANSRLNAACCGQRTYD